MKFKELIHLPTMADLGEFGKSEFRNGVADIRRALIEEGWFGQSATTLGWDLPDDKRAERNADNPLLARTEGSDLHWTRSRDERAQELDFDR